MDMGFDPRMGYLKESVRPAGQTPFLNLHGSSVLHIHDEFLDPEQHRAEDRERDHKHDPWI